MNTKEKQIEKMQQDLRECHDRVSFGGYDGEIEYTDYEDMANLMFQKGYRKQEWISVEDRLPNEDDLPLNCLVVAKVGNEVVVDWATRYVQHDRFSDERESCWEILHDWDEGQGCEITHWMPLPEAPEGE